jgi:transcriptional regulator with XRE-family HTH domain
MNIKQLKKELGLSQKDLAEFFGMSYNAYANSSAKKRYETALCRFYECVLLGGKKEN